MRVIVVGIGSRPGLEGFNQLVQLTGYSRVVGFIDAELFAFCHPVAQSKGFLSRFCRLLRLRETCVIS